MKVIALNLRELWKKKRMFFCMIILVQVLSTFSCIFIIGTIISNYKTSKSNLNDLYISILFNEKVTYDEIEEVVFEIFDGPLDTAGEELEINTDVEMPDDEECGELSVWSEVSIKDGKYVKGNYMNKTLVSQLKTGRGFTDRELNSEECKAIVVKYPNEELIMNGEKYEIIGVRSEYPGLATSVIVAPKKLYGLELGNVVIKTSRYVTEEEMEQVVELLDSVIGEKYELYNGSKDNNEDDLRAVMRSVVLSCVLIGIVLIGTLVMLYLHIWDGRKYKLAVFRLTGCKKLQNIKLTIGEMLVITIPSVAVGLGLFYPLQTMYLNYTYAYMDQYITWKVYLLVFVGMIIFITLFLGILAIIRNLRSVREQILAAKI